MFKKALYLAVSFMLIASGCKATGVDSQTKFMRINGAEVTPEEYGVYLDETKRNFEDIGGADIWETDFDGRSAKEVAQESALNSMVAVKISAQKAEEFGIILSNENNAEIAADAQAQIEIYKDYGIKITEQLKTTMEQVMRERKLYSLVRQATVKDYVISETEYDAYCENYFDETARQMRQITIKTIRCENEAAANEVYQKAINGDSYDDLFDEYNADAKNGSSGGVSVFRQKDMEGEFSRLIEAQAGFIGRPIDGADGVWSVFKVVEVKESDSKTIKDKLRSDYTNTMWQQIFSKELDKWTSEAVIEKNDEAMKNFMLTN